jgi:Uma2 family endonuclease
MNQQVRLESIKEWASPFTADDFLHMLELGAFEDMRAELVRGEIEKMMPADWSHGELVIRLSGLLFPLLQAAKTMAGADVVLRIDDHTVRAFDIAVVRAGVRPQKTLAPQDVLFGIEIAETTQRRDLGEKREEYGGVGIPAYWVVDTVARVTHCFLLDASGTAYGEAMIVPFGQPMNVPGLGGQITLD